MDILGKLYTPDDLTYFEQVIVPKIFQSYSDVQPTLDGMREAYDRLWELDEIPDYLLTVIEAAVDMENVFLSMVGYADVLSELCPDSDTYTLRRYIDGDEGAYIESELFEDSIT